MRPERQAIYKAEISTPFGLFLVAVEAPASDAAREIYNITAAELRSNVWMLKITTDIKKSHRGITKTMDAMKSAATWHDGTPTYWAWIEKLEA